MFVESISFFFIKYIKFINFLKKEEEKERLICIVNWIWGIELIVDIIL